MIEQVLDAIESNYLCIFIPIFILSYIQLHCGSEDTGAALQCAVWCGLRGNWFGTAVEASTV